jgi:hypothetical protein
MHEHHENNETDPSEFSGSGGAKDEEGIYLFLYPARYFVSTGQLVSYRSTVLPTGQHVLKPCFHITEVEFKINLCSFSRDV